MPQVVFVLSLFDGAIDQHVPDLDHTYHSKGAARKARIALIKEARKEGVWNYDWGHWWCVSYSTAAPITHNPIRGYYTNPKDQCGIIIEECIVND